MSEDEWEAWLDPAFRPGAWANETRVIASHREFTVDFAVRDPLERNEVTVVARVVLSDHALMKLKDQVDRAWAEYARWALPKELKDDEEGPTTGMEG